jgi:hypothetical protein
MGEVVSLRRARKAKARAAKEREASLNRVRFGTGKAERDITSARSGKEQSDLEGKKLDSDKEPDR